MKNNIYSVFDSKAQAYGQPFHAPNDAVALRMFGGAVNDPGTQLNQYPEDFALYCLGAWDDQDAKYELHNPRAVTTALAIKVMTNHEN